MPHGICFECVYWGFRNWKKKRGKQLFTCLPPIDEPLTKLCFLEELYASNHNNQTDDRQYQEIFPDDRIS